MRTAAATRVLLAVAALIALTACSGGDDEAAPSATVGTQPPQTTTTDPYAVPRVIDVAYVNRVLAGLDQIVGDVVRLVVETRTFPREAYDRLRAAYATDEGLQLEIDLFQDDLFRGLRGYKVPPGNAKTTVAELISGSPACVFAKVTRDYSDVSTSPGRVDTQWVGLKPLDHSRDPNQYNATNWAFIYDGFPRDRSQPRNPCGVT